jgi:hypothetical protein
MNRIVMAGVAFAAVFGVAGFAQAQPNNDNYEHGGKPSVWQQSPPSAFSSPSDNSPQYYPVAPGTVAPYYAPAPAPAYGQPYPPR